MRGTLRTTTSSSVRTHAARIGSAPFLFPAGTIVPDSGTPPSMTNFSMSFARRPPAPGPARPAGGTPGKRNSHLLRSSRRGPADPASGSPGVARSGSGAPICKFRCSQIMAESAVPEPNVGSARRYVQTFASLSVRRRSYLTNTCSPLPRTSTLAQRALGALRLTRSFLLLEDDYDVDWEVGQDERARAPHPHRAPLRGGCAPRRAGQLPARPQACLSPVGRGASGHGRACLRRPESRWVCSRDVGAGSASRTSEH